ncbi:TonB-dependent receptor [Reichenbachiella sp. MALMAid0571]|uniref:TonB-dependent receptor domain-containing protein n=1 Tax=Reichenbachiella sp. MALMAid0571 TaxID=3143939 RepID=UPI0032E01FA4
MRKLFILLLVILLTLLDGMAQNTYRGQILDTENNPLVGALIISSTENKGVVSDVNGKFSISSGNEVEISFVGYKGKKVTLTDAFNTIILDLDLVSLGEVVISGNRELQQRNKVPASISILNAKRLNELKSFGIEQIVNTVPGVFMQSSVASSNEQHQMSVRSPISTKALFLYVEDGIPIRPTAVFNHNALLEMNSISFDRIEVTKGPSSSIYGSEAIGGSFNFITKQPTQDLTGSLSFQINNLGFKRYEAEISDHVSDKLGIYVGAQYSKRQDGIVDHSDYHKFAATLKTVYHFNGSSIWTNHLDIIDYKSDMAGSISEKNFFEGNYESNETFTNRVAKSVRLRSTFDKYWNDKNKTSFNLIFRNNLMDQIPSYRTTEIRQNGQLTGEGIGESNSDQFTSYAGLIQHKMDFDWVNSSLVAGLHFDYSPQDYIANTIDFDVNLETGKNENYSLNAEDYILNYNANIFNYAGYLQYEISPLEALQVTAALRYDKFVFDYNNRMKGVVGVRDGKNEYTNIAPKIGLNYNFSTKAGLYANVSNGFSPPQTSTLYRNGDAVDGGETFNLKPSSYYNYEIGGYFSISNLIKLDVAFYDLEGRDVLVSYQLEDQSYDYRNAGKTRSYGIEYGLIFTPVKQLVISHNGSYARHQYLEYFDGGNDYSNTNMEEAPSLLGNTIITYKPFFVKNLSVSALHNYMGKYNTAYENTVVTTENGVTSYTTPTYQGYSIFDIKVSYKYKKAEIWGQLLNIFDRLYSINATYSYGRTTYTIGNPRTIHAGIKYKF